MDSILKAAAYRHPDNQKIPSRLLLALAGVVLVAVSCLTASGMPLKAPLRGSSSTLAADEIKVLTD
jgi:hypothetical protein